jgi:DNA topoisomerase VI subunit A
LIDEAGQIIALAGFEPSVGLAAAQAQHLRQARVDADQIICVENQTTFYELICHKNLAKNSEHALDSFAAICLWGNPSPACRQLLSCLSPDVPLRVWADIDYGGLNILAQLREQVNRQALPYGMDIATLEAHARWAQPLTTGDVRHLNRLLQRAALADMRPLIEHLLRRGLKLEQEAILPEWVMAHMRST